MVDAVLKLENVQKGYPQAGGRLEVLKNINLTLKPGELVALIGPSGSGKSTLLQVTGLLDVIDDGRVEIVGKNVGKASDRQRTVMRRKKLGFVYQFHHLLPEFSALENVMMPLLIHGTPKSKAKEEAMELLGLLGLKERASHRPARLSGGEQQRVAILRAIAHKPALLLADEPTGNLDPDNANAVFDLLVEIARTRQLTALIATHNPDLAKRLDRTVRLEHGELVNA